MRELRQRDRPSVAGFTLFEVVVAVAVFGLVLATALGLLGAGLRSVKASEDYTEAVLLARRMLDELVVHELRPGIVDGSSDGRFRWSAEVIPEDTDAEVQPARLFTVRVTVFWTERHGEKQLELVTLVAAIEEEKLPFTAPSALRGKR